MDERTTNSLSLTADPIRRMYPAVDENVTPLPRQWSTKDKSSILGLSQNNLMVHYKGLPLFSNCDRFYLIWSSKCFCTIMYCVLSIVVVKYMKRYNTVTRYGISDKNVFQVFLSTQCIVHISNMVGYHSERVSPGSSCRNLEVLPILRSALS